MSLTRRDFIRLMGGTAAALAFPSALLLGCRRAVRKAAGRVPVIWIQALSCGGCSVSLLDRTYPDLLSLITERVSLNFHQTLMGGSGAAATGGKDHGLPLLRFNPRRRLCHPANDCGQN